MLLQWIMGIIAISALVIFLVSDRWTSKSKHSSYYENAKKPSGKEPRLANLPDTTTHDKFYSKLNAR